MADPKPSGVVNAGGLTFRLGRPQQKKPERTPWSTPITLQNVPIGLSFIPASDATWGGGFDND